MLQGSPVARRLYEKLGWKDVEKLDEDLSDWAEGGKEWNGWGVYRWWYMVREPSIHKERGR